MTHQHDDTILIAHPGGYPMRHRPGSHPAAPPAACHPLLIVHPYEDTRSPRWIGPGAVYGGRPVAVMGARDMESFLAPADIVARDIVDAAGWRDAREIHVLGQSTGAFAALLYAALISLALPSTRVAVMAFSPLVCVWPMIAGPRVSHHERTMKAGLAEEGRRGNLERFGDTRPWINRAVEQNGDRFSARLLYAARNERDAAQAVLLKDTPGVTLIPMPTALHGFYRLIALRGPWEAEVAHTRSRLEAEAGMGADEALQEATAMQSAFATAAASEPDLYAIFTSKRRKVLLEPEKLSAA